MSTRTRKAKAADPAALVHRAHDGLLGLVLPIAGFKLDPRNARAHSDRNIATIKASLKKFGQRKPIVVQREGMVIRAGNGTMLAAQQLGWTGIAALVVEEADAEATAYALVDNRSAELAEWDWPMLESVIDGLDGSDIDLLDLGWSAEDIEALTLVNEWQDTEPPAANTGPGRSAISGNPVKFTDKERAVVDEAIALARTLGTYETDGQAVVAICNEFIGQHRGP